MAAKFSLCDAAAILKWVILPPGLSLLVGLILASKALAQVPAPQNPAQIRIEPGLESVVKWPWSPEASDSSAWGLALMAAPESENSQTTPPGSSPNKKSPLSRPQTPPENSVDHTVQKGDSLYVIARSYGVTIDQIKASNKLKGDRIVLGQILHIPSIAEIQAMAPPPAAPARKAKANPKSPTIAPPPPAPEKNTRLKRPLPAAASSVARVVLMQSYLDRQGFSAGPIDGTDGPLYDAALRSYEAAHPGELSFEMGQVPAVLRDMGGAYTEYQLRQEDARWIAPETHAPPRKSKSPQPTAPEITLESLTSASFLPYRSVWEFVAERYHCSEAFLRRINPGLRSPIGVGTLLFVPNVVPFEIENALTEPLQPPADPAAPITATIVSTARLEVRRSGKLIANLPVSVARPGLRGRGTWKILNAIPRPRLTSLGDPAAPSSVPLVLPPGPNNPVGPIWINLAKGTGPKPLPYGLHGTSIPGYMTRQESVGGFRMTNWDIARAVRLLPIGTPLTWE